MSVINSVLRDLDRKPTAFTPLEVDTVIALESNKKSPILYWAVLPVIAILVAMVYWMGYRDITAQDLSAQKFETASNEPVQPEQIRQSEPQLANSSLLIQPLIAANNFSQNQISGLQIRENEEYMELAFQLTDFTPSFLKQRSNNRYVFVIKKVSNSIVTPQISDSPWLKQMQISTLDEDVEIRFDTQPGVLVDTLDRREEASYYWLIKLKKSLEVVQAPALKEIDSTVAVNSQIIAQPAVSSVQPVHNDPPIVEKEVLSVTPVKLHIRPVQNKDSGKMKLNAAIHAANSGDISKARKSLETLLAGEFDYQARNQLLVLLIKQNDTQSFNELLTESLQKYPQDEVYLLYEANRLFAEKQYLTLIDKFKTHTENDQLLSLLATSYQRTEQHELATQNFISALKINPQQPRLWISLAISQQNLSQREQALNSYQMALRSGPMNQRLHDFVQTKIKQLSN